MFPLRRHFVALALGLAAASAMSNSFMLAPGTPTSEELRQHIAAGEARLREVLKGKDLEAFVGHPSQALPAPKEADELRHSDVRMHSWLTRRWDEVRALLKQHDPKFLQAMHAKKPDAD